MSDDQNIAKSNLDKSEVNQSSTWRNRMTRRAWSIKIHFTGLSRSSGRAKSTTSRSRQNLKIFKCEVQSDARKGILGAQKKWRTEEHLTVSSRSIGRLKRMTSWSGWKKLEISSQVKSDVRKVIQVPNRSKFLTGLSWSTGKSKSITQQKTTDGRFLHWC